MWYEPRKNSHFTNHEELDTNLCKITGKKLDDSRLVHFLNFSRTTRWVTPSRITRTNFLHYRIANYAVSQKKTLYALLQSKPVISQ